MIPAVAGFVLWLWAGDWLARTSLAGIPGNLRLDLWCYDNGPAAGLVQLGGHAAHVAVLAMVLCGVHGAGRAAQGWLGSRAIGGLMDLPVRFVAGFATFSAVILALGLNGLLERPVLWAGSAILALVSVPCARLPLREGRGVLGKDRRLLAVSAGALAILLPVMVAPELEVDSLYYHLPLPLLYLEHHRLHFVGNIFSNWYGHAFELVLVPGLSLGLDSSGRCLNGFLALACGLSVASIVRRFVSPERGWLAMAVFLSLFSMARLNSHYVIGSSKSDMLALFTAIAAFGVYLDGWIGGRVARGRWFILGALGGAAWAVKVTVAPFVAGLAALLLVFRCPAGRGCKSTRSGGRAASAALCLLGAFAVGGPWMAWSYLVAGNPVFPAMAGLMVSPFFSAKSVASLAACAGNRAFPTAMDAAAGGFKALVGYSPVVTGMLWTVFLMAVRGNPVAGGSVAASAVFVPLWWFGMVAFDRYGLPLSAPLVVAAIAAFEGGRRKGRLTGTATSILAAFSVAWGILGVFANAYMGAPLGHLLGLQSRNEYYIRSLGIYGEAMRHASRECPGRTLVVGESRSHPYGDGRLLVSGFGPTEPLPWKWVHEAPNLERLSLAFRREGIRWLLYDPPSAAFGAHRTLQFRWTSREMALFREFMARYTVPVWASSGFDGAFGTYLLYRVDRGRNARPRSTYFVPGMEPEFWKLNNAVWGTMKQREVDGELDRLGRALSGTGAYESRKGTAYALRALRSPEAGKWLRAGADGWWNAAEVRGPELDALTRIFPVALVKGGEAGSREAFRSHVVRNSGSLPWYALAYSLIQAFPAQMPSPKGMAR